MPSSDPTGHEGQERVTLIRHPDHGWTFPVRLAPESMEAHLQELRDAGYVVAEFVLADSLRGWVEELEKALEATRHLLAIPPGQTHAVMGEACGEDACVICLVHGIARAALAHPSESERDG